ncbi:MAG: hypothetical protein QME66_04770 [Candidatus Eisenbacteria bacterium]|nr:hypothetical protein [Candidatus Eisenbacteria bacterium]
MNDRETFQESLEIDREQCKRRGLRKDKLRADVLELLRTRGRTFDGFVRQFGYRRALPGVVKELIEAGIVSYEPLYRKVGGWSGMFRLTEAGKNAVAEIIPTTAGDAEPPAEREETTCGETPAPPAGFIEESETESAPGSPLEERPDAPEDPR